MEMITRKTLTDLKSSFGLVDCSSLPLRPLSLGELCQLAILAKEESLASSILSLSHFPSLWSCEAEYDPIEAKCSINLLLRAFGKEPYYKGATINSSYFRFLEKELPTFIEKPSQEKAQILTFGQTQTGALIQSAFVNVGEGVALGAMKIGPIEVPAFGPQVQPLNNPQLFGMHRTEVSSQWSAVSAQKEIWFEHLPTTKGFETRFMGLTPENRVCFVFYVKAELAIIGNEIFPPKSLLRYCDESKKITFQSKGSHFSIENTCPCKMELIPLAGSGCFWESDFLLGFELPVHDGRAVFELS